MSKIRKDEMTAVDDVRVVREAIAAAHAGDIREHVAETNRIFSELQTELDLKVVPSQ